MADLLYFGKRPPKTWRQKLEYLQRRGGLATVQRRVGWLVRTRCPLSVFVSVAWVALNAAALLITHSVDWITKTKVNP